MGKQVSIIQNKKECFVCGTTQNLQLHHCLHGTANRKLADKYKLTVWLCWEHHLGNTGVHQNRDLDTHLKKLSQKCFEAEYGQNINFCDVFGRNYL